MKYKEVILTDEEYLPAFLYDIHHAVKTIDLEVYIFQEDRVGKQVTDALCQAAKRGVKVRVLVDGIGSIHWGGDIAKQMERAGIETKVFHPVPWKLIYWRHLFYLISKLNIRNHRKVCIMDKHIVYVGSANLTDHFLGESSFAPWRETAVKLINVDTDPIQYAFNKAWNMHSLNYKKYKSSDVFHLNYSWRLRRAYYKKLVKGITKSKKRIWITNSYFVPYRHLLRKLIKSRRRGVDVRILLPGKSDVFLISWVGTTFYEALIKKGIIIYEYLPTMLHAKVVIMDEEYRVGSSNLNHRSVLHDLEVDVEILDENNKKIIEKQFLHDLTQSREIKLEDLKQQPLFKKIICRLILLIKYWL